MLDPAIQTGLLQGLQRLINRSLHYDPGTRIQLSQLQGKQICIRCKQPQWTVYVTFEPSGLRLWSQSELPVDCELEGSASDLFTLVQRDQHSLADSGVRVTGDVALLGRLQRILGQVDLDWEAAINDLLGDTLGHPLATLFRHQFTWGRQRLEQIPQWLPDYLSEELNVTPHRLELQNYYEQIHSLSSDCARLEARITKLERSLQKRSQSKAE